MFELREVLNKSQISEFNYWTRVSKTWGFVSGDQINYFPKAKAEANN